MYFVKKILLNIEVFNNSGTFTRLEETFVLRGQGMKGGFNEFSGFFEGRE